jgi:hypothetical protein
MQDKFYSFFIFFFLDSQNQIVYGSVMKYKNESTMPGPGDQITWKPCTGNPLDPRTEEEPEDDRADKSDPREMDLDIQGGN